MNEPHYVCHKTKREWSMNEERTGTGTPGNTSPVDKGVRRSRPLSSAGGPPLRWSATQVPWYSGGKHRCTATVSGSWSVTGGLFPALQEQTRRTTQSNRDYQPFRAWSPLHCMMVIDPCSPSSPPHTASPPSLLPFLSLSGLGVALARGPHHARAPCGSVCRAVYGG